MATARTQPSKDELNDALSGAPEPQSATRRIVPPAGRDGSPVRAVRLPRDLDQLPSAHDQIGERINTEQLAGMGQLVFLSARPKTLNGLNGTYTAMDVEVIRVDDESKTPFHAQVTGSFLVQRLGELQFPFRDAIVEIRYNKLPMWIFESFEDDFNNN